MNFRSKAKDQVELNLVPLVDVILTLLVFFMLTTTFEHYGSLKIQLPTAESQKEQSPQVLEIAIDADGRCYLGQHRLLDCQQESLKQAIAKAFDGNARPLVVIAADRKTPHEFVVRALAAAQQLGLKRIAFATQERKDKE